MKVIIPVAGKGTRMRPFTHTVPKSFLPIAGKPVIAHILDKILPLHPTEIIFVTGHLKHRFEEELRARYPGLQCSFVEQETQRGTADAIWTGKAAFDEDVLIVFSDTIFDADLGSIRSCGEDGILWAKEVPDPSRFGVLVTDSEGIATRIVEKPPVFVSNLANIGLYYVKDTAALAAGIRWAYETTPAGKEVYLTSAFEHMIAHGKRLRVLPVTGWYDTGTTDETLASNRALLELSPGHAPRHPGVTIIPPVAIDPSAVLEDSVIGPHVSVAGHTRIVGSVVRDSVIDAQSAILQCKLAHSIVGQHVEVRDLEGSVCLGDHSRVSRN